MQTTGLKSSIHQNYIKTASIINLNITFSNLKNKSLKLAMTLIALQNKLPDFGL